MSYLIDHSPSEAVLDLFRSLRGKGGHFELGLFIAEAPKVVRQFLLSKVEVPYAYMTPEYFERFRGYFEQRSGERTSVILRSKPEMEEIVGYSLHQGIMIAGRIPAAGSVSELFEVEDERRTIVVLDSIADAENMGGIIRNVAAFGATAVIVDEQSCHPFLRRSVRVSMGTIANVKIVRVPELALALKELRERGVYIIAADQSERSIPLSKMRKTKNSCLIFGAEGRGIRDELLPMCDELVEIPMAPGIDSLNVGVASGIFLYEAMRK